MQSADSHPFCSGANFRVPNIRNISLMKIWRCCSLRTRPSHFEGFDFAKTWHSKMLKGSPLFSTKDLSTLSSLNDSRWLKTSLRNWLKTPISIQKYWWKWQAFPSSVVVFEVASRTPPANKLQHLNGAKGAFWEHHEAWSSRILLQHLKSIRYQFV